jgi:hypothetical protein
MEKSTMSKSFEDIGFFVAIEINGRAAEKPIAFFYLLIFGDTPLRALR